MRSTRPLAVMFSLLALTLPAAASIPHCSAKGAMAKVNASWYGVPFHGRTMANGKKYNMNDATTVAHKSLPFGTKVRLRNPVSGVVIVAVVRDRGPYIAGRTFDLSKAGAQRLGTIGSGVARLESCIQR